ncbi:MAG: porin family protein [Myxococcales bacterium]|nr:porin family protein [Myxococcales bacterium]
MAPPIKTLRTTLTLGGLALCSSAGLASADERVTIGGFVGTHIFSDAIELGTFDDDGEDSPRNTISFGIRAGYLLVPQLRLEGELAIAPGKTREAEDDITVIGWRAQALVDLLPEERLHPFATAGIGFLTGAPGAAGQLDEDTDLALHMGVGAEFDMASDWSIRADARALFVPSTQSEFVTTDFEFFVGAVKRFPAPKIVRVPDGDGDGVHDGDDACPDQVEDQDGYLDEDGCPDPDNDGDGVLDALDQCPAEAESKNGVDDEDGCPEPDGDGDGVLGSEDLCPQEPEDMDGKADEDGCPEEETTAPPATETPESGEAPATLETPAVEAPAAP